MSAEIAHFQNFAKLKDTSLAFNDITVLAGKPSTGKSFVMKFMYAIDATTHSIVKNPTKFNEELDEISKLVNKLNTLTKKEIETVKKRLKKVEENVFQTQKSMDKNEEEYIRHIFKQELSNFLQAIFTDIEQISNKFNVKFDSLQLNYINQIISTTYDDKYSFSNSEPIFVETPLILEFKKFMKREKGKTPYHIESLLNILDTDYSFTDEEQDKFIKDFTKKSKAIIGGDIESSGDSFIFNKEGGQNYDILNASSGTKSIGLLQYLVTNKALKKGSVLYWEEPEVHLHPEWQLKMVDLFVELMNAGVKIVFSTHSPYMADYLNAISKKQKFRDRISFNVLDEKDGVVTNHILDDDNWNILQKELMDTFEDILWQYL